MKNTITTRFMSRLFSATEEGDEELTAQVAQDIQDAKKNGAVETDEVRYENNGDGSVSVIDKDNGEVTIAEQAEDGNFDLYAMPTGNLEQFVHPEGDGVTPGIQQGVEDECAWGHLETGVISPNVPDGGLNPMAGYECTVEENALTPCDNGEEREFSVATDNQAVLRIFNDQAYCERVFSEVLEKEETANVGDLKVEKIDDDTVVVTSKSTGDQARVTLDGENMQVDELTTKDGADEREFSEEEQFDALHVVGVDPVNHVIVDAPEYDVESAQELVGQLTADGVQGVAVFDNPDDARDYAANLMESLGAETVEDVEEPVQTEYSDHTIFVTKFYSAEARTSYMDKLFSEVEDGVDASQKEIEYAIENSEEVENDSEIITPVDSETAVVEDKETGEFTKVTLDGAELDCKAISKDEAEDLVEDVRVVEDDDEDEEDREFSEAINYYFDDERYFSDIIEDEDLEDLEYSLFSEMEDEEIYTNDEQTKFFSESEELTAYQQRLFSGEADEKEIENAIENGEQIENDSEIITPVDEDTAIIEDKETGEFTKAILDDETIDVTPISEEEADKLTDGLRVSEDEKDEDEKEFSDLDYQEVEIGNPVLEKFFAGIENGGQPVSDEVVPLYDAEGNPAPIGMDAQGNVVPVANPAEEAQAAPSLEVIEDTADQAVNLIQQAAQEAANQILQAKQAPVQGQEQDLQEAQFSEVEASDVEVLDVNGDPLISWMNGSKF